MALPLTNALKHILRPVLRAGIAWGLPSSWFGYRWVARETVPAYVARRGAAAGALKTIHAETAATNPLPRNVIDRNELPDDRGWWGFSFWDVPTRTSGETFIATLHDCLVTWYRDEDRDGDFYPAIVAADGRALDLREIRFRWKHGQVLRTAGSSQYIERATWVAERVYDNHSHWLTAHLPKILLLQERGLLEDVLLPPERTATIDDSLRRLGLDPDAFSTFDMSRPLRVGTLTLVGSDRFRPELLRMVSQAFTDASAHQHRRVYVSRARASRRRLRNEEEVWPLFEQRGFERVIMEDLAFSDQIRLMQETAVLAGPHGAGLTNMLFCAEGTPVIEIADLGFPNPNFYALASALSHPYWIVRADSVGEGQPLEKDLHVAPEELESVLDFAIGVQL